MKNDRQSALLFHLFLAQGLLTLILSLGIEGLVFHGGMPLPELNNGTGVITVDGREEILSFSISRIGKIFLITMLIAGIALPCIRIVRKMTWRLLRQGLFVLSIILLITGGIFLIILFLSGGSPEATAEPLPVQVEQERSPLGTAPLSLYWLAGVIVFLAAGTVIYFFLSDKWGGGKVISPIRSEFLKMEKKLRQGADFRNTILVCYGNMLRILSEEGEISREKYMTAEEFRDYILASGMPEKPVRELTSLFEKVRYGTVDNSKADTEKALKCLQVLIEYFDRVKG